MNFHGQQIARGQLVRQIQGHRGEHALLGKHDFPVDQDVKAIVDAQADKIQALARLQVVLRPGFIQPGVILQGLELLKIQAIVDIAPILGARVVRLNVARNPGVEAKTVRQPDALPFLLKAHNRNPPLKILRNIGG